MIEIRPEELLTLCVRPRLGRMIDEDKRQSDQTDGRRIHLTEEEICLKNRDQLCESRNRNPGTGVRAGTVGIIKIGKRSTAPQRRR